MEGDKKDVNGLHERCPDIMKLELMITVGKIEYNKHFPPPLQVTKKRHKISRFRLDNYINYCNKYRKYRCNTIVIICYLTNMCQTFQLSMLTVMSSVFVLIYVHTTR